MDKLWYTQPDFSRALPVIAIDPGLSGAVARFEPGQAIRIMRDFKTLSDLVAAITFLNYNISMALIEKVHAMPGEGVCSVFSFGKSTGTAMGALLCSHAKPVVEVPPQTWQNYFKRIFGIAVPFKQATREIAKALFPGQADLFRRKKDHNSADAALLAYYGAANFESLTAQRDSPADTGAGLGKRQT